MKINGLFPLVMAVLLFQAAPLTAQSIFGSATETASEDVVEEVVITRRMKKVASPHVVQPVQTPVADEPPPPPVPSAQESSSPERIIRYFCSAWKDENWEKMYWAMTPKYRKGMSLKKFTKRFEEDAELNGGLSDENIEGDAKPIAANMQLTVVLKFKNKRVKPRVVKALVNQTTEGYRVIDSGIIPIDLSDL